MFIHGLKDKLGPDAFAENFMAMTTEHVTARAMTEPELCSYIGALATHDFGQYHNWSAATKGGVVSTIVDSALRRLRNFNR